MPTSHSSVNAHTASLVKGGIRISHVNLLVMFNNVAIAEWSTSSHLDNEVDHLPGLGGGGGGKL